MTENKKRKSKKKTKIIIKGMTLDFQLPSESRLSENFLRQDTKTEINEKIQIRIAPTRLTNKFKSLRRKFYTELEKHAFILGKGAGHRNLYLVPVKFVPSFLEVKEELSEEYKKLESNINSYLMGKTSEEEQEYREKVREYLAERGIEFRVTTGIADAFNVDLFPLEMSPNVFEEYLDSKAKKQLDTSLDIVKREVEETRRRLIEREVMDLQRRFEEIIGKLIDASKKRVKPKVIEKSIDEIMDLAEAGGVDWMIKDVACATKDLTHILTKKEVSDGELKKTVKKLGRTIGMSTSDDPYFDLEKAREKLLNQIPERWLSLMDEL